MQAGMIGLGAMGANMARNLARKGFLKTIWNRTPGKALSLAEELMVPVADSPAGLAASVDIVCICVSRDEDVLAMVDAIIPGIHSGSIVVDMSTVSSSTARQAQARLKDLQADFLDAPVSGGVEGAANGTLAMMVGGNQAALQHVQPVLSAMTSRIVHFGGVGSGQSTKAVNQIMAAGINQAVTEALAFGSAQGLPMHKVIDVISAGAAGNWFMQHRGPSMIDGHFKPGFKLSLHYKDLKICQAMTESKPLSTSLLDMTVNDYEKLMAQGFGDEDISSLYRLKHRD